MSHGVVLEALGFRRNYVGFCLSNAFLTHSNLTGSRLIPSILSALAQFTFLGIYNLIFSDALRKLSSCVKVEVVVLGLIFCTVSVDVKQH